MVHSNTSCNIPDVLSKAAKSYENFYLSRHSGRRLTWQLSLGSVDMKVAFNVKKHDINVSTFAAVILLLFEDVKSQDFLTYKVETPESIDTALINVIMQEIQASTGLAEPDLKRHLQSLACAKYKILKKHPMGRDVNDEDSFSFNEDFKSPLQRIKIGTVSAKVESSEERKETHDRIDEERRHQTEV